MYGWVKRREKERERVVREEDLGRLVGWLVRVGWQNRSGMSSTNYIAVRNERNPFAAREAYKQIQAIRISSRVEHSRNAANTRRIRERRVRICSLVRVARSGTSLLNVSERFDREGRGAYSRESADGWEKERKRSPVCVISRSSIQVSSCGTFKKLRLTRETTKILRSRGFERMHAGDAHGPKCTMFIRAERAF